MKKLRGNPGKRKLNKNEPEAPPGIPEMPQFLTAEARAEWKRIIPLLVQMGVLTAADGKALAGYCSAYAQLAKCEAAIEKYGLICATLDELTGVAILKVNPAVRIKSDALRLMKAFLTEFGLTPASRSKLSISKPDDNIDPFETFLQGKPETSRKPN